MQFLKTLFWVALAVILVLFATVNWNAATIHLWGGLEADVKLPILVLASFLLGFLPMLLLHRARMWSMMRRVEGLERQMAVPASTVPAPPPVAADPAQQPEPIFVDNRTGPAA